MKILKTRSFLGALYGFVCLFPIIYLAFNMLFALFSKNNTFVNGLDYSSLKLFITDSINEFHVDSVYVDFFVWFDDLFLNVPSGSLTELTIQLVNWSFNYVFFVSCGYLLFAVLMWFINFSRKLLDRGMNYDW